MDEEACLKMMSECHTISEYFWTGLTGSTGFWGVQASLSWPFSVKMG